MILLASIFASLTALAATGDLTHNRPETFELDKSVWVSGAEAWTDWAYAAVDPTGKRIALIQPGRGEVVEVILETGNSSAVAGHAAQPGYASHFSTADIESYDHNAALWTTAGNGRSRSDVSLPLAVAYDAAGRLAVSDAGNRRILIFDRDGEFEQSFLLTGPTSAPNEVRILPNGNILAAGLNLDSSVTINAGNYCTIYAANGAILHTFAYTPQVAFDSTLWLGVSSLIDVDDSGNIYQVFSVEGIVRVYDFNGILKRTLDYRPGWFYPPHEMKMPLQRYEDAPEDFYTSWPRIMKLVYVGSGKLIIVGEANDRLARHGKRFVYDIVTIDGEVLQSTVFSDDLPIGGDRDGLVYKLSLAGDKVYRVRPGDHAADER